MDSESPTIAALHTLYIRLTSLRGIELADSGVEHSLSYEQTLIEEAYAALSQVETELDALRTELEYHNQRFDAKHPPPESGSSTEEM